MRNLVIYPAFAALALLATACSGTGKSSTAESDSAAPQTEVAQEANLNYKLENGKIVSTNGLPMIVDFSAEWCPPCRQLKPIFHALEKEYEGKVDFVTINVDSMPELSNQYKVESIPNMVFINPEGDEVYRSVGFREADQIKGDITKYLSK